MVKRPRGHQPGSEPASAPALQLLADVQARLQAGHAAEAVQLCDHILRRTPHHAQALYLRALAAIALGARDEALIAASTALRVKPHDPELHFLVGYLQPHEAGDAAVTAYRRVLALQPHHLGASLNLGDRCRTIGAAVQAASAFRSVTSLAPGMAEGHCGRGIALHDLGLLSAAEEACRRAVQLAPELPAAHYNLAVVLLQAGQLKEGFEAFEWRWRTPLFLSSRDRIPGPRWQGESNPGTRILVHAEQGLGDVLQFCRYIPLMAARGLHVAIETPKPLLRLLARLDGVRAVVIQGETLPAYDYQIPVMSLPHVHRTDLASIPCWPNYLSAAPDAVAAWQGRLAGETRLKVGLAWAGNPRLAADHARSIAPGCLHPLAGQADVAWYSLQKDATSTLPMAFDAVDFMDGMNDFADTAALVANLDLVITVDSAIAHLAGALGRPVWLLNRFSPDWRWMLGRDDSPWYPTLRQFRQHRPGDWHEVVARVGAALAQLK